MSDEEFFQTVACNPFFPHDTLRTHNDNLRFVNWWGDQASPAIVPPFRAVAAANSGALFGRKFSSSTEEGRDGIRWIESYLADSSRVRVMVYGHKYIMLQSFVFLLDFFVTCAV